MKHDEMAAALEPGSSISTVQSLSHTKVSLATRCVKAAPMQRQQLSHSRRLHPIPVTLHHVCRGRREGAPVYSAATQANVAARLAPMAACADAAGVPEPALSAAADPTAALHSCRDVKADARKGQGQTQMRAESVVMPQPA